MGGLVVVALGRLTGTGVGVDELTKIGMGLSVGPPAIMKGKAMFTKVEVGGDTLSGVGVD